MAKQPWLPPATSRRTSRRSRRPTPTMPKRSFKEGAAFFEKLASAKSLQEAIEIRTEYTKTGYATFVAESKRIAEMYNELSKIALKPFGGMNRENVPSDR